MKKYIILIVLVALAGCVGQREVKVEANNGLKIQEFSADPLTAEFNDNVLFAIDVENVGGTTAKNVELKMFGIENIWAKIGGSPAEANDTKKVFGDDFEPPVQAQNRPGDFRTSTKTFLPPLLPEGVEQDFPVTARVTYQYSTTGSIVVPTISKSLLRIKSNKGEAIESSPRITNSFGPLKIGLDKGTIPIVVDETRTGEQEATFVIEFLNVGDGFPVTESKEKRTLGLLQGSMTLLGPGAKFDECLGIRPSESAPNKIEFTDAANTIDLLKLRSNGRLPLSCTIKIDRSTFTPTTSGIITFSISMNYRYFVEKMLNVHVIGTKETVSVTHAPTPTPTPVSTVNITLVAGWNFISLPVTPSDNKVETIISAIKDSMESIWHYEGATGEWFAYITKGPSNLPALEPGKGYEIKMKEAATLEISGAPFKFQLINLAAGKNYMIGAPYTDTKLSDVIGTCNLEKLNLSSIDTNNNGIYITVNPDTLLSSGKGYWIKSTDACTLQR